MTCREAPLIAFSGDAATYRYPTGKGGGVRQRTEMLRRRGHCRAASRGLSATYDQSIMHDAVKAFPASDINRWSYHKGDAHWPALAALYVRGRSAGKAHSIFTWRQTGLALEQLSEGTEVSIADSLTDGLKANGS